MAYTKCCEHAREVFYSSTNTGGKPPWWRLSKNFDYYTISQTIPELVIFFICNWCEDYEAVRDDDRNSDAFLRDLVKLVST